MWSSIFLTVATIILIAIFVYWMRDANDDS